MKRSSEHKSAGADNRQNEEPAEIPAEELMHRYSLGDQQAFDTLYDHFAPKVFGFLQKQMSPGQAAEAFQETFLRLHRYRSRYDRRYQFAPWLFAVCRSAAADCRRKYARQNAELTGGEVEDLAAQESEARHSDRTALKEAVAELSPRDAEALSLRFGGELDFEQVAGRLGTSEVAARKIVSRAIARLRKALM